MDLAGAEQSHGKGLTRAKAGAFAFLLLAGALLISSLLLPTLGQLPGEGAANTTPMR